MICKRGPVVFRPWPGMGAHAPASVSGFLPGLSAQTRASQKTLARVCAPNHGQSQKHRPAFAQPTLAWQKNLARNWATILDQNRIIIGPRLRAMMGQSKKNTGPRLRTNPWPESKKHWPTSARPSLVRDSKLERAGTGQFFLLRPWTGAQTRASDF